MEKHEHKELVEQDKEYEYIGSIRKKSGKKYYWYLKVKHLYCNNIYEVEIYSWKKGCRPCGLHSYNGCCGNYENSFAYYIEVELGLNLNDIWNWEKNNELNINPYYIAKSSNKKVWLYCQKHDYHNYDREGNKIGYEVLCNSFSQGYGCEYCGYHKTHWKDSLAYNYPHIVKMIAIEENNLTSEDCYNISCGSGKRFYFKCLDCETISNKKYTIRQIVQYGYSCRICSDGLSIPEKFITNILKQLNIDFKIQLTKTDFDWCKDYKYDFYLPKYNTILETHGMQHYKETNRGRSLEEEQANDRCKKHLAKTNRIKRYYSIDCRYSELEWLKENIIKTLGHLFDLSNVDWKLAWEECQKSKCIEAWNIYNNITHDMSEISNMLNLHIATIRRYLKRGVECGKCNYTKKESKRISGKKNSKKFQMKVICITTKKIFNSMTEGANKCNTHKTSISDCCRGEGKSAGKLKDGTPLVWRLLVIDHNRILRGENIKLLRKEVCK